MRLSLAFLLVLCACACSTAALAATTTPVAPKSGGFYSGASAAKHAIHIKVAKDGRTARVAYCKRFKLTVKIVKGRFGGRVTEAGGLVTDFRVRGSWKTRAKATGYIDLALGCGSRPGPWAATLK